MSISLLSEKEFSVIKQDWNNLLEKSSNNEFFLTWDWVYTWWQVYSSGKELFILCVRDDSNNLIGIAPFYIKKEKLFGILDVKKILFLGIGENVCPEYLNIITETGHETTVANELLNYLQTNERHWSMMYLTEIIENHPLINAILLATNNSSASVYKNANPIPCVYLALPKNYKILLGRLSSKFRYNIKWGRNKIQERSQIKVSFFLDEGLSKERMGDVFRLHNMRMEEKGGNGKFNFSDYREFHTKLLERLPGHTAVVLLESEQKAVAMIYGYHYSNKIYFYQSGFDPSSDLKKYSMVQILLSYLIEKAIALGCLEFDFLRGDEYYKHRWSDSVRKKENIIIFNSSSWAGQIANVVYKTKQIGKIVFKKK